MVWFGYFVDKGYNVLTVGRVIFKQYMVSSSVKMEHVFWRLHRSIVNMSACLKNWANELSRFKQQNNYQIWMYPWYLCTVATVGRPNMHKNLKILKLPNIETSYHSQFNYENKVKTVSCHLYPWFHSGCVATAVEVYSSLAPHHTLGFSLVCVLSFKSVTFIPGFVNKCLWINDFWLTDDGRLFPSL